MVIAAVPGQGGTEGGWEGGREGERATEPTGCFCTSNQTLLRQGPGLTNAYRDEFNVSRPQVLFCIGYSSSIKTSLWGS